MFNKIKLEKFSIRKFKVGVASAMIGASWMLGAGIVNAQETDVNYHYVLESELTIEERAQIVSQLPSTVVGNIDTYYMVYRPTETLPQTSSQSVDPLLTLGGIGLVVVGVSLRKRKRVVTSLLIVLATGQMMSVSAIENGVLSGYDKHFSLEIGQVLPETVKNIPNYTFVGYLLRDNYPNVPVGVTELVLLPVLEETPQPEVVPTPEETPQPEVTPAPEETQQPEVIPAPEETQQPEVTPAPEETPQPEVTPTPEETQQPEVIPAPEETQQPEVTPAPEKTPQPEVTPAPEETPQPEVTPAPEKTPQPEVTPTPEKTPQPEVIPAPEETQQPEVTPTPEETQQPEVTPTPEETQQPEVTPTPEKTPQPEVTPAPEETQQPEVTPTPEKTPQPEVTPTPEKTPQPEVTPTPEKTPQPEVTPTPEKTPQPEVTPTPEKTPQPEVTPAPEKTPQPEVTPTPEKTPQPEVVTENKSVAYRVTFAELKNGVPSPVQDVTVTLPETVVSNKETNDVISSDVENLDETVMNYTLSSLYDFVRVEKNTQESPFFHDNDQHIFVVVQPKPFDFDAFVQEIKQKTPEERYIIAKGAFENPVKYEHEFTQEELNVINAALDKKSYNQELVTLINQHREQRGAAPLDIDEELALGTSTRANEQAIEEGFFRSVDTNNDGIGDQPHTRPNGDRFATAFNNLKTVSLRSENAGQYLPGDIRELISEKWHAEKQFERFSTSKDHMDNMMNPAQTVAYFDMAFSDDHLMLVANGTQKDKTEINGQSTIFIQAFGVKRSIQPTTPPEVKTPSKEALEAEVGRKDDLRTSDKFLYATPDLMTAYNHALTDAEKILKDPNANQASIDEALRALSDAAQVLNGRLEDKVETKEFTRTIKFVNEKDEVIKDPIVQKVVFTKTDKVSPQQNNAVITEGTWQSDKPVFETIETPEIEGYLLSTDTVTTENVSVETQPENKEIVVRYKEKNVKKSPEIEIVKVDTNSPDKWANVNYTITDTDNVVSKKVLKVYHQDQLVKEYTVREGEVSPHQFAGLEHNKEYVAKLEVTYDLGEGALTKEVASETFELLAKKVEFKNLKSTELYKIEADGKATLVTGLNEIPTDKQNYMVKLVDSQNKEILLTVDTIAANGDTFRVTSKLDNLVHHDGTGFQDDFVFDVNKIEVKPNHYTSFKDLVAAMNTTPAGTFYLATDMIVEGDFAGDAYISKDFTGSLQSADGKKFSISGLTKPLFNKLASGSKISHIAIKDANVTASGTNTGILARTAANATITNLTLTGNLTPDRFTSPYSAGSVAGEVNAVTITNSLIDTNLTLHASSAFNMYAAGGVFGKNAGNTKVSNVAVNVDIIAPNNAGYGQSIGGVIGEATGGTYEKILVTGTVKANQNDSGVAAIAGKITAATVRDIVTGVQVTNGSIGNGQNMWMWLGQQPPQNIYTIKDVASGSVQPANQTATPISQADANNYAKNWQLPSNESTTGSADTVTATQSSTQTYPTDFSDVADYQASHKVAYENFNKLLPFYDRNTVVKIANKVATGHTLNTSAILAITPLKNNEFVTNLYDTTGADKVLIHFANGNKEEYALTTSDDSPNSRITEYKFEGELLYTPHVLKQEVASALTNAVSELKNTAFDTAKMREVIGEHTIKPDEKDRLVRAKRDVLKELYLEDSFTDVQNNLENVLQSVISNQFVSLTESDAINRFLTNEVKKDKEKVLLGLAYLNKWYDVNFNDRNIKNLALYRPDFFGKTDVNVLDYLKEIGGAGYEKLLAANSDKLYADKIAPVTTLATITDYLERNKALFAPDKDMNQWFKDSSKAYIVESDTTLPNEENAIYNRLKAKDVYKAILLPLLTVSENTVFAVVHPGSISYGSFDTYLPKGLRTSNPTEFGKQVETVKAKINAFASKLTNYYNMWNGVMSEDVKGKFAETPIRIVDGHHLGNAANDADGWAERYSAHPSVREFFGPLGFWFPYAAGESGYADRNTLINLVTSRMLDDLATLTHEFIHHFDERNLFNGHKHRPGQSIESYALGLLESTAGEKPDSYGFNTIVDIASNRDTTVNHSVSRFNSGQDLATYMKGMMDVTYTLDLLEAEAILSRSNADKVKAFDKISLVLDAQTSQVDGQTYRHANDKIEAITEAEANALRSIADLIQHNIVGKDHKHVGGGQEFTRDNQTPNYTYVSLYKGFYAAMSNAHGTVGSLQFRRAAFEFLAEKGWEDGFLNYATDKLKAQGIALNDTEIFKAIFANEYANYQDFKLKQFNKRKDALNRIKEITVTVNGKTTQINAGNVKTLMEEAVQKTLSGSDTFAIRNLKEAIIVGYMKATNDFTDSIYN